MNLELIKILDVAKLFGVSKTTIYRRLADDPDFPKAKKIGNSIFFLRNEIEKYLEIKTAKFTPSDSY